MHLEFKYADDRVCVRTQHFKLPSIEARDKESFTQMNNAINDALRQNR
jgi:hypothetical protein